MAQTPEKIYKELAWAAAGIVGVWLGLQATQGLGGLWPYRYARSAIELVVFMATPSLCLALITNCLLKRRLGWLEFLNICAAWALLGLPAILSLEYLFLGSLPAHVGLLNSLAIAAISSVVVWLKGTSFWLLFPQSTRPDASTTRVIIACTGVYIGLALAICSSYYQLPDPDGYDWISRYNNFFHRHEALAVTQRPLFYFFVYMLNVTSHIDQYAVAKYVLPLLPVSLILPATLLLKRRMSWPAKGLVLLAPLSSASTILYLHTPIPQTISLVLLHYALFWLARSYLTGRFFWYAAAGLISILTFFYHEASIFISVPWILATTWHYRRQITSLIKTNKTMTVLLCLLVLSNAAAFLPLPRFMLFWVRQFWQFMDIHGNWLFPARYTNIDGNVVGWSGLPGIIKYYIYYVGPFVVTCTLVGLHWFTRQHNRLALLKKASSSAATLAVIIGLALTLAVAEIFPRLFNISLLPERAWLYAQVFYVFFIAIYAHRYIPLQKKVPLMLLVCIVVNISGALFINNRKKYITPDYKQISLLWLKEKLPENSIFISASDIYLLRFHAQKNLVYVPAALLCLKTGEDIERLFGFLEQAGYAGDQPLDETILFKNALATYFSDHAKATLPGVIAALETAAQEYKNQSLRPRQAGQRYDMYVYYAKPHSLDPYAGRPYVKERTAFASCQYPSLDNFPATFTRVYNDADRVKIWKIL